MEAQFVLLELFLLLKKHTPQQQQQFPSLRVADAKHQMLDQPAFCHAKRSRASCEAKVFEVASSCQTAMLYSNIYVCRWTQKVNLLVLHLAAVEESTEWRGRAFGLCVAMLYSKLSVGVESVVKAPLHASRG